MPYEKDDFWGRGPRPSIHPSWSSEYDRIASNVEKLTALAELGLKNTKGRTGEGWASTPYYLYPTVVAHFDRRNKRLGQCSERLEAVKKASAWLKDESAKHKMGGKPPSTIVGNKDIVEVDGLSFVDAQMNLEGLLQDVLEGFKKMRKEDGV